MSHQEKRLKMKDGDMVLLRRGHRRQIYVVIENKLVAFGIGILNVDGKYRYNAYPLPDSGLDKIGETPAPDGEFIRPDWGEPDDLVFITKRYLPEGGYAK